MTLPVDLYFIDLPTYTYTIVSQGQSNPVKVTNLVGELFAFGNLKCDWVWYEGNIGTY